jgi:hypothetical protein
VIGYSAPAIPSFLDEKGSDLYGNSFRLSFQQASWIGRTIFIMSSDISNSFITFDKDTLFFVSWNLEPWMLFRMHLLWLRHGKTWPESNSDVCHEHVLFSGISGNLSGT